MAVDPHTAKIIAKAVISQITDEEKRQRLIIWIIISIVVITLIILIPIFAKKFTKKLDRKMISNPTFLICLIKD